MTTLIVMAMEAEAAPVREVLGLGGDGDLLHPAFPARLWIGERASVAVNGTDPRFGVDSIATQPAVTTTLHAIERTAPSTVVSAGTAGGFAARGGAIGSIYLAERCVFHDRRITIPAFERYGDGDYPVIDLGRVAGDHGWGFGTVSTGNSLDAPEIDLDHMGGSGAVAKDMEAAAVAWVCERVGVPFSALKVITDLVDTDHPTEQQFLANLRTATETLSVAVGQLVDALGSDD